MARKRKKTDEHEYVKLGRKWLDRLESATKAEKDWLDDAKTATQAYTGEGGQEGSVYDFNILFSNVETIVPAVINSAPAPDIRRRFGDADPVARQVAEIIERAIRVQVDDSKLQVELEAQAQDAFLAGRGVIRIRFKSDIVGGEPSKDDIEDAAEGESEDDQGEEPEGYGEGVDGADAEGCDDSYPAQPGAAFGVPAPVERLANERIAFESVSWIDYRHGPAKRWDERPWEAFRFCIPREEEGKSFDLSTIRDQLSDAEFNSRIGSEEELTGWEFWCKESRKVYFIDDAGVVLKVIDDPLGLSGFFPAATPIQPIEVNGRLCPVNPFAIYRRLADDLDAAVKRRAALVRATKVRGWYALSQTDLETILDLDDNEFAPIKDAEIWASSGGIEKAITFWPIERFIAAIQQLDVTINAIKQMIYEITGISDIVRGASNAGETATAQNIKSQWGSLRIQKMQRMMERCARELFIMMSEIIPAKFSLVTLEEMTSIDILPKQGDTPEKLQLKAAIMAMMKRGNLARYYRIDVESDSTVRADLTRQKQEVAQFLQGTAQYFQAVAPLVQQGALPAEAAVEIFASNARMFNLGKSVEDTLEQMVTKAKQMGQQQQQKGPSPEVVKMKLDAEKAKLDATVQMQELEQAKAKFSMDMQQQAAEFQSKQALNSQKAMQDAQDAQISAAIKQLDLELKRLEVANKQKDLEIKNAELAAKTMAPVGAFMMETTI